MSVTTIRTDWLAYSSVGALITTFSTSDLAGRWAETEGQTFPGFRIVRRRERITEDTVFTDIPAVRTAA